MTINRAADLAQQAYEHHAQAQTIQKRLETISQTIQFLKSRGHAARFELRYTAVQRHVADMFKSRDFTSLEFLAEKVRKLDFESRTLKRKLDNRKVKWVDQEQFTDKRELAWEVAKKIHIDMQQLVTEINKLPTDSINRVNYNSWLVNYNNRMKECCANGKFRSLRRLGNDVDTVLDYMRAQVDIH